MRPLTCLIAAGMFAVAAVSAHAAPVAYGEAFDTLYRIDLATREASVAGRAGQYAGQTIGNISGLTTLGDGSLYAVGGSQKLLLTIDTGSGRASVVGPLDVAGQGGGQYDALDLTMIAGCNDTLWLSSGVAKKLWTVDRASGKTTPVGATGAAITGLAARGSLLYGAAGKGDNTLYRIDPASGKASAIGGFGTDRWINSLSMSFDEAGTLWAVLNYVPPPHDSDPVADWSDLAKIDPASGRLTVLGPITGPASLRQVGMRGFTLGPAPCGTLPAAQPAPIGAPWTLVLLGALLALAGRRHFRRAL